MDLVIRALQRAASNPSVAVQEKAARMTYSQLLTNAELLRINCHKSLRETLDKRYAPRIGCMCDPGSEFVAGLWSTWLQGCIFVPIAPSHPAPLMEYEMADARLSMVRSVPALSPCAPIALKRCPTW